MTSVHMCVLCVLHEGVKLVKSLCVADQLHQKNLLGWLTSRVVTIIQFMHRFVSDFLTSSKATHSSTFELEAFSSKEKIRNISDTSIFPATIAIVKTSNAVVVDVFVF